MQKIYKNNFLATENISGTISRILVDWSPVQKKETKRNFKVLFYRVFYRGLISNKIVKAKRNKIKKTCLQNKKAAMSKTEK